MNLRASDVEALSARLSAALTEAQAVRDEQNQLIARASVALTEADAILDELLLLVSSEVKPTKGDSAMSDPGAYGHLGQQRTGATRSSSPNVKRPTGDRNPKHTVRGYRDVPATQPVKNVSANRIKKGS